MDPLVVSDVLLWIVVAALAVTVLALARQVGVLHERVAPLGAMATQTAVETGERAPEFDLLDIEGRKLHLGGARSDGRGQLLLFVSPICPMCKKLMGAVRSFAKSERKAVELVLMGDGEREAHRAMAREHGVTDLPFAVSPIVGMRFGIGKLPYAVLIDAQGVVRAKGIVNSREHLESLLVAQETGYSSIQDYLVGTGRGRPNGAATRTPAEGG
ncbi:MAG: methylamine dehydrogenase accessory protein MauD [Geminicoccaceae bacterium]|nr:methylamine dehydrogenase accessory protein MauD [Geminicoccaceae bacterium]MCX8101547.1 methylamine dehydrogenase accessory protein MauD [Geminicoccaceae bacterium]MDW8369142.1 methylamine dehydrogenase accessory protein MauD [Geminicoccaceae bacterium]